MPVTQIPGLVLQVNNIIVILESVINYDYTIMIIKQGMLYANASENLRYLESIIFFFFFFKNKLV